MCWTEQWVFLDAYPFHTKRIQYQVWIHIPINLNEKVCDFWLALLMFISWTPLHQTCWPIISLGHKMQADHTNCNYCILVTVIYSYTSGTSLSNYFCLRITLITLYLVKCDHHSFRPLSVVKMKNPVLVFQGE